MTKMEIMTSPLTVENSNTKHAKTGNTKFGIFLLLPKYHLFPFLSSSENVADHVPVTEQSVDSNGRETQRDLE